MEGQPGTGTANPCLNDHPFMKQLGCLLPHGILPISGVNTRYHLLLPSKAHTRESLPDNYNIKWKVMGTVVEIVTVPWGGPELEDGERN